MDNLKNIVIDAFGTIEIKLNLIVYYVSLIVSAVLFILFKQPNV